MANENLRPAPIRNELFIARIGAVEAAQSELSCETDRGMLLVGGAMIDELLRGLLCAYFIPDDSLATELLDAPNAPAGTFSSRIKLVRGLGIVSKSLYRDLEILRKLRNKAAHFSWSKHAASFQGIDDNALRSACAGLSSFPTDRLQDWYARGLTPRVVLVEFTAQIAGRLSEMSLCAMYIRDNLNAAEPGLGVATVRNMMRELADGRDFSPSMVDALEAACKR